MADTGSKTKFINGKIYALKENAGELKGRTFQEEVIPLNPKDLVKCVDPEYARGRTLFEVIRRNGKDSERIILVSFATAEAEECMILDVNRE